MLAFCVVSFITALIWIEYFPVATVVVWSSVVLCIILVIIAANSDNQRTRKLSGYLVVVLCIAEPAIAAQLQMQNLAAAPVNAVFTSTTASLALVVGGVLWVATISVSAWAAVTDDFGCMKYPKRPRQPKPPKRPKPQYLGPGALNR